MPLRELIRRHDINLQALNRSSRTILLYKKWLAAFADFMKKRNWASPDELRAWLVYLQTRPKQDDPNAKLSDAYVLQAYRHVKAFILWCWREGYIEENPMLRVPTPATPESFPRVPTVEEVRRLLDSINRRNSKGLRDYSVVLLLIDTGIRAGELEKLGMEDLDLRTGSIRVMGKGRKHRLVPIGEKAKRALWHWLQVRPKNTLDDSVFVYANGLGVTQNWLRLMLARRSKAAGLKRINPHSLRHFFATRFLANGEICIHYKES